MYVIEHANKLGWKDKFGLPTGLVMEAIGIKSYSVYKKTFDDLAEFGFFEVVQYSKNQYTSNVIALKENCKASGKAHDKAHINHLSKHGISTLESTVSIDKLVNSETDKQIQTLNDNLSSAYAEVEKLQRQLREKSEEAEELKTELAEERKKVAAKKKVDKMEHWKELVEVWTLFYQANHNGAKPTFTPAAGAQLKQIVGNLRKGYFESQKELMIRWDCETAILLLKQFLQKAWDDGWIKLHFSLPVLLSKYDEIVNRNGQSNSKNGQQSGGLNADYKRKLAERMAAASGGGTYNGS